MLPSKSIEVITVSLLNEPATVDLLKNRDVPVVIRGCDVGPCLKLWTCEYLQEKGRDKRVKVHKSPHPQLDFRQKNFTYETVPFADLVKNCSEDTGAGERRKEFWYLRSLGEDPRGKDVSDLEKHFPELYADISIPSLFPKESFFSSIFRITSPNVQLWTHYDTCDNILMQIRGRKRIVFYAPSEALKLYLDGDKSKVIDIDSPDLDQFPLFASVERYEVLLEEGDIVFIPALWFHNVTALDFSISVNVFWKGLDQALYDKKDTYGNRDLIPAQLADSVLLQSDGKGLVFRFIRLENFVAQESFCIHDE